MSWFDDPSDRVLLDLIPLFEDLAKADDVYVCLGNENLPSSTTMYIGAISFGTTPQVAPVSVPDETQVAPIFSSSVQSTGDQKSDADVS